MKNIFKREPSEFTTEYTVTNAIKKGDVFTKLSCLLLGAGNIVRKQVVKGLLFLLTEIAYFGYMFYYGFYCVAATNSEKSARKISKTTESYNSCSISLKA